MVRLLKFLVFVVMMGVIPATGIMYWGATNLTGKVSIVSTGALLYVSLAFFYSWLSLRPKSFKDWLRQ